MEASYCIYLEIVLRITPARVYQPTHCNLLVHCMFVFSINYTRAFSGVPSQLKQSSITLLDVLDGVAVL